MILFNKFYKHFNILSITLVLVSIILLTFKGLNFGIDFKGGTLIELRTENNLINVSTLPKTNMLIIDEGFGALDETNLESCSKLLKTFKKWFKNIIIISHIDAIKDIVDNTIEITKEGVDSHVYQP